MSRKVTREPLDEMYNQQRSVITTIYLSVPILIITDGQQRGHQKPVVFNLSCLFFEPPKSMHFKVDITTKPYQFLQCIKYSVLSQTTKYIACFHIYKTLQQKKNWVKDRMNVEIINIVNISQNVQQCVSQQASK